MKRSTLYLAHLRGGLLLENSKGDKRWILPARNLKDIKKEAMNLNEEGKEQISIALNPIVKIERGETFEKMKEPYFQFQWDAITETLKPTTPQGALYGAIIARTSKNYKTANALLKQFEMIDEPGQLEWELIKQILNQPDYSPEGAAFDLRLGLQIAKHCSLKVSAIEDFAVREIVRGFKKQIMNQATIYFRAISRKKEGIYSIPYELRLKKEEITYLEEHQLIAKFSSQNYGIEKLIEQVDNSFYGLGEVKEKLNLKLTLDFLGIIEQLKIHFDKEYSPIETEEERKIRFQSSEYQKKLTNILESKFSPLLKELEVDSFLPRIYPLSTKEKDFDADQIKLAYLLKNFHSLYKRAIGEPSERKQLRTELFFLLRNQRIERGGG
jgi:hypothetical protein